MAGARASCAPRRRIFVAASLAPGRQSLRYPSGAAAQAMHKERSFSNCPVPGKPKKEAGVSGKNSERIFVGAPDARLREQEPPTMSTTNQTSESRPLYFSPAPRGNPVVQLRHYGGADELAVVDAPLPTARRGEVRVRMLASGMEYTDVTIRRHLYPQTRLRRPPFVMGYDVVGEIDQLGEGVRGFQIGDRVADMTVVGSNAAYRTLRANDLTRVPEDVDAAEGATLILSWTTAYQLLHRAARVTPGQRVLVHGAAGAVGQALLTLGHIAGLEVWGAARGRHAARIRELGATPVDYEREDFTRVLPGGFDVVFDGIGEDGFRKSLAALHPRGVLSAYGYSSGVGEGRHLLPIMSWIARLYFQRFLPGGRRAHFYSINIMRAQHPAWFKEDLGRLFELLSRGEIHPQVAERISFESVAEAHRRLETGGLEGKLVLCAEQAAPRGAGERFASVH
jgi:NADPH2:quinone reductase